MEDSKRPTTRSLYVPTSSLGTTSAVRGGGHKSRGSERGGGRGANINGRDRGTRGRNGHRGTGRTDENAPLSGVRGDNQHSPVVVINKPEPPQIRILAKKPPEIILERPLATLSLLEHTSGPTTQPVISPMESLQLKTPRSFSIMDESLRLQSSQDFFLEKPGSFIVVGIIGNKGVGKSTLASALASQPVFPVSTPSLDSEATTKGVDCFATPDRTIIIDTPALHFETESRQKNTARRAPNALSLITWTMMVCQVLIIVSDTPGLDFAWIKSIKAAAASIPKTAPSCRILIVGNRVQNDSFIPAQYVQAQRFLYQDLGQEFVDRFQVTGNCNLSAFYPEYEDPSPSPNSSSMNLFLLSKLPKSQPLLSLDMDLEQVSQYLVSHRYLVNDHASLLLQLKALVLGLPRTDHKITERDWYRRARQEWSAIQDLEDRRKDSTVK